ncbi:hypothetical protein [Xanthobacter versatilis]|uniref:hypothetical protein n=1 Tax=Xanthobacter autotrophicus (strain ATCC BAA-1158 / Py2) TaxID=78245 RepID=UPI0037288D56
MKLSAWICAPALLLLAAPAALAQGTKSIDQIRAACQAENPPGRQADRSTLISRCIERKKQEAAAQKK